MLKFRVLLISTAAVFALAQTAQALSFIITSSDPVTKFTTAGAGSGWPGTSPPGLAGGILNTDENGFGSDPFVLSGGLTGTPLENLIGADIHLEMKLNNVVTNPISSFFVLGELPEPPLSNAQNNTNFVTVLGGVDIVICCDGLDDFLRFNITKVKVTSLIPGAAGSGTGSVGLGSLDGIVEATVTGGTFAGLVGVDAQIALLLDLASIDIGLGPGVTPAWDNAGSLWDQDFSAHLDINIQVEAIPEPSTALLLGSALAALSLARSRSLRSRARGIQED